MTRPTIITVIAIVLIFLLLALAGGMDKADAASPPLTEAQARGARHPLHLAANTDLFLTTSVVGTSHLT
jgi:hypothetical protein